MNIIVVVAWGLLIGAGVTGALGILASGDSRSSLIIVAISLLIPGFIMLRVGSRLGRLVGANPKVLQTGTAGTALITAMRETGVSMGGIEDPVFEYALDVTLPNTPTYRATISQRTPRMLVGAILPGVNVTVRADPNDPQDVAIDWQGDMTAGGASAAAASPARDRVTGVRSTADILRNGTRGTGVVKKITKMGELGEFTDVPSNEADDPVFHMILEVRIPGRPPYDVETAQRFPDSVTARLTPGMQVEVAVDLDDPMDGVAIDLERL